MARILVQTDDRRTVLEAANVELADINEEHLASDLLERLERAITLADRSAGCSARPLRRLASIVPLSDYRDLGG